MERQKIYKQHEENKKWMNDLLFFQDELKVMSRRLSEIAAKNTSKEVLAQLEHFQNQAIVQQNNIDELKHHLNVGNDHLRNEIEKYIKWYNEDRIKTKLNGMSPVMYRLHSA